MSTNVHLSPALERFAREAVADGRYNNVSEVVRHGLRMLQDAQDRQRAFVKSLEDARTESDRIGYVSVEEAGARMDAIIDAAEKCQSERG